MKFIFNTSERLRYEQLLCLIAFSLPFPMIITNWLIGILAFHWIISNSLFRRLRTTSKQPLFWVFISLYIIQIVGMLYTTHQNVAFTALEHRLTILAFPLIIFSSPKLELIRIHQIFKSFVTGCLISLISAYGYGLYQRYYLRSLTEYELNNFYLNISNILGFSHVYYGIYLVFSFFIICYLYINVFPKTLTYKLATGTLLIILLVAISLSGSIMSFIGLWVISVIILVLSYKKQAIFSILIVILPVIIIFAALFIKHNTSFSSRLMQRLTYSYDKIENNQYNYSSTRMAPLKCSLELSKQYWLFGVGSGDLPDKMHKWYVANNLEALQYLNSHNQYLDYLLTFGIGGLLIFIATIVVPLYESIQKKQMIYVAFLLLFAWCCLSENVLNRNKGIIFYSFFNAIMASQFIKNKLATEGKSSLPINKV